MNNRRKRADDEEVMKDTQESPAQTEGDLGLAISRMSMFTQRVYVFLEEQYAQFGFMRNNVRCVTVPMKLDHIGVSLGMSAGSVKTGLHNLEAIGYILRRDKNLYLHLANASSASLKPPRTDAEEDYALGLDPEDRRLSHGEIRSIIRDLLNEPESGMDTALKFVYAHRDWCARNSLEPHV